MGHAYTPGLRVAPETVVRRERRLPLKGDVCVARGAEVGPGTVVARCELPGNVQTVNLAAKLGVDPAAVGSTLLKPVGAAIARDEPIAEAKAMFGLVKNRVASPADGTLESVSSVTGQLLVRERPIPVEVNAYVQGHVAEVLPGEGAVVESRAALVQGIFGVGGETHGTLAIATSGPGETLGPSHLKPEHRGAVLVGGDHVSHAQLARSWSAASTTVTCASSWGATLAWRSPARRTWGSRSSSPRALAGSAWRRAPGSSSARTPGASPR